MRILNITPHQKDFMLENYHKYTHRQLGEILQVSSGRIGYWAIELKLKKTEKATGNYESEYFVHDPNLFTI